jgi:hypothetical protein
VPRTIRLGRSIATELRQAQEGRPRRKFIRGLVSELGSRMWAPEGVPARIAVTLPPAAKLRRAADRVDPGSWYRLELSDGRTVVSAGFDLVGVCATLARLSEAQRAGDEPAARRALQDLCGPPRR